jgi:hypothetical protein
VTVANSCDGSGQGSVCQRSCNKTSVAGYGGFRYDDHAHAICRHTDEPVDGVRAISCVKNAAACAAYAEQFLAHLAVQAVEQIGIGQIGLTKLRATSKWMTGGQRDDMASLVERSHTVEIKLNTLRCQYASSSRPSSSPARSPVRSATISSMSARGCVHRKAASAGIKRDVPMVSPTPIVMGTRSRRAWRTASLIPARARR